HQIIQRMRTGILVCDPRGSLRMANAAARELLCEPGQPTLNTLPQPLQLRLEEWLNNPDSRSDAFRARPTLPQIQPSLTRLHQEGDALILIFLEDTSKIAQQAQQLKLASLGRLTAAIAHEIRNPLGAISHAAQLLAESETLTKADRKMCDIIQRHSRRVNTIVENVLQLSRRTATRSERIELNRWLGTFVTDFSQSCQEPCELRLEPHANDPEGLFDPSQLEQVLTNLVENGLRYSAQRTGRRFVILRVGMTEDGERNYIEVQDEGPGIPVEQRDSVFEPFYTTEQGGTGLGLYIARELCEANQAQLTVVPGRGPGACFRLLLAYRGRQP
ncbi:MAG: histidine kinase, partial [Gammaproteobacteria bacterium]|nr:histidine kinase [Gammaproteobacteria bacterium]